jgi:hypothetical protein
VIEIVQNASKPIDCIQKACIMVLYISEKQLTIEEFKTPFQKKLSADNRWVKLSQVVPWDEFASAYMSMLDTSQGRPAVSPRIVLGAMIIKHLEKLDDRGVILAIQENIYMQYFVGLKEFTVDPVFDPSLFVQIRKRVGRKVFDSLNADLIRTVKGEKDQRHNKKNKKDDGEEPKNKGKLQADATVADQDIAYPTDNGILNESRKKCEKLIDALYELDGKQGVKPRTYRRTLDRAYLDYSKKKTKSRSTHRKMTRKLLECVNRNTKHINRTSYDQQKYMYEADTHSYSNRIVSIYQPHVRPIPRGKLKSQAEFGAKLGVSLDDGFARINTLSWDAYHEAGDLINQVEAYKELHGHYPELVQVDKIYATRENRMWLKERGIRITAPPLGRKPVKAKQSNNQKRKKRQEAAERNHLEGKFGQGKNGYNLNQIRARLKDTSESWIACIFFVMNLIHYETNHFFGSILKWMNRVLMVLSEMTEENRHLQEPGYATINLVR